MTALTAAQVAELSAAQLAALSAAQVAGRAGDDHGFPLRAHAVTPSRLAAWYRPVPCEITLSPGSLSPGTKSLLPATRW